MKVMIAYLCHYADRHDYFLSLLPVGAISLAAGLEAHGYDVHLANFSREGARGALRAIEEYRPDVLGVSLFSHNRIDTLRLLKEAKKRMPRIVTVAGGPHASALADALIARSAGLDHVITGEAEDALLDLLKDIQAGKARPGSVIHGGRIGTLDALPPPGMYPGTMTGVDPNEQFKTIITSRGCPYRCAFCCSPGMWERAVQFRSAAHILREIEYLYRERGIIFFSIRDDNFTLRKDRVMEFCKALCDSGMYIMWNCQSRVDTVDEEMLVRMKLAGCEQIQFGVESGSEHVLERYGKGITVDQVREAARIARRAGLYVFYYLMAGMEGEKLADIRKTVGLIRQTLPGDGIVSPVALYPGTEIYEQEKRAGRIDDNAWFTRHEPGLYLRKDDDVAKWIGMLVTELGMVREHSWYREKDFRLHRRVTGPGCWVTDILEGDYYRDSERFQEAEACYLRVAGRYTGNPWGFLRLGKICFYLGKFEEAAEYYTRVTGIVPGYYGGWLKRAESLLALKKRDEARMCAQEAFSRNPHDFRVKNIVEILKK